MGQHCMKSIIACQAPLKKSQIKFWQMIWENKTNMIVMVAPWTGPKGEECTKYLENLE